MRKSLRDDATFVKLNSGATSFTIIEDAVLSEASALASGQTNLKSAKSSEFNSFAVVRGSTDWKRRVHAEVQEISTRYRAISRKMWNM